MSDLTVEQLLTPPDSWQWGEIYNDNKQKIRIGWNIPANARALIVIAEGRTEVIEEYFEIIRDLNAAGFACAIMDWQGHGMSYRYFDDNTRHHSQGFERDITDFGYFLSSLDETAAFNGLPKILLAHSMGSNITLHFLAKNPTLFRCAYLVSPMLALNPKHIIRYLSKPILNTMRRLNRMHTHAFTQSRWTETFANIAKYKVSSDPVRREVQPYLFRTRPELQCGGVTFGWLTEALEAIETLHNPDFCRNITTPVYMAIAGKDIVVDNNGTLLTASLLPHCETEMFEKAEHQIHRERDDIREAFFSSFFKFINRYL